MVSEGGAALALSPRGLGDLRVWPHVAVVPFLLRSSSEPLPRTDFLTFSPAPPPPTRSFTRTRCPRVGLRVSVSLCRGQGGLRVERRGRDSTQEGSRPVTLQGLAVCREDRRVRGPADALAAVRAVHGGADGRPGRKTSSGQGPAVSPAAGCKVHVVRGRMQRGDSAGESPGNAPSTPLTRVNGVSGVGPSLKPAGAWNCRVF